jgi:pimeloyl-ACP methyl ester carboxylesterase
MSSFVLIPGAGGMAWYWSRVVPLLRAAGHEAVAVDLPGDDENAGFQEYADLVVRVMDDRRPIVLVAQSLGGFTAPLVCARHEVDLLVLVNAMIPRPNETAGDWWKNTGSTEARVQAAKRGGYSVDLDFATYFFHDVPEDIVREGAAHERPEAESIFAHPCRFDAWPDVPIHVVVGKEDRFFPKEFQERVARERLGKPVELIEGGHLVALSNPKGLADRLLAFSRSPAASNR